MKIKKVFLDILIFPLLFAGISIFVFGSVAEAQGKKDSAQSQEILATDSVRSALESVAGEAGRTYEQTGKLVIVLDPGHDNTHSGASANGLREETLNFKIARYCKEKLENYDGVTVYMTRENESCPYPGMTSTDDNANRVYKAAELGADVFISFHLNSSPSSSVSGVEVYYPNANYNSAAGSLGQRLAQVILNALKKLGLEDLGIKIRNSEDHTTYADGSLADYYGVIRRSKECGFPGIIIEHAFISSASDANRYLRTEAGLKSLGEADADAIISFFDLRERDSVGIFDAKYYYDSYQDLQEAIGWNESALWQHFKAYGIWESRVASPVFDVTYYRDHNADLQETYGNDLWAYAMHFVDYGMQEQRQGSAEFDVHSYRLQYADLRQVYRKNWEAYYRHYIDYGRREGRQGTGCSSLQGAITAYQGKDYSAVYNFAYYMEKNSDIKAVYGDDDIGAIEHFVKVGMSEGRSASAEFDIDSYRRRYADLRRAFGNDKKAYYQHYISYGKSEGRQGTGCSSLQGAVTMYDGVDYAPVYDYQYYVDHNPDVKAAYGLNDGAVLEHFVRYGMAEGRTAKESFRAQAYRDRYGDLQQAFGNDWRAYYLHYLEHGLAEGRQGA